jgi:hypothetical protein
VSGKPASGEPDEDEKRRRVVRAREAIEGAGWAFDAYARRLTSEWINSEPDDSAGREAIWHRQRALLELKAGLASIINESDNDEVLREHRERHRD